MGKKVRQASVKKTSKSDKKQINSLIKVLRPKVYITDRSSFKKLVQEVTGNGNTTTTNNSSPPPPPPPPPQPLSTRVIEPFPDIHEDYHHSHRRLVVVSESSVEELSVDSFEPSELAWQNQACFDEITALENYSLSTNLHGGDQWSVNYQDIESWLLDIEPFSSYNCAQVEAQEVCIYDYELSGI